MIDYTKFTTDGKAMENIAPLSNKWWLGDEKDRAQSVMSVVKQLMEFDTRRQTQYQISARLYGNASLMGTSGLSFNRIVSNQNQNKDRVTFNVVQSGIDTVTAKMSKNRPRPYFLTSGGDWKTQRRAQKLNTALEGIFYENNAYALGLDVFRDGAVFGDGYAYVYKRNGRVVFERVMAAELFTDTVEAFYGQPRQIHRVKNVDRDVLAELYPEHKAKIMMANNASEAMIGFSRNVSDQVTVVESWRLPSVKGSKDGKHTISIQDCVLFDEVYEKDHFPFANFKWCKRLNGYWAQGAAEQIQNIQLEINKILWIIQRSYHLAGSFKVLLENGSKIVKEHLNNDVGAIINYSGTQPTYITPPVIPVEYYGHLQTLKQSAYEQLGVSQLSASSKKPEGLDSGKALREFNDIESERFMAIGKAYEDFYLQLGKLAVDCAREIALDDDYEVGAVTDDTYVKINWREVDLDEDSCTMQIFPISSFSNDPAARLQEVQEYVQAGFISPRQARRLFDFPDLKQIEELANSKENYLHKILEQIVDDGIYTPPEPYDDLELALQLGLEYYSKGKLENLEDERLELLRQFTDSVKMLMAKATQPQPTESVGAELAQPVAPPQSDLLPFGG